MNSSPPILRKTFLIQLRHITDNVPESLAHFIRQIKQQEHAPLFLAYNDGRQGLRNVGMHCPDSSFTYLDAKYPQVIIEVALSQSGKELANLANTYIVDSLGEVQVAIGVDLGYGHKKRSKVMVWRPTVKTETGKQFLESALTFAEVHELRATPTLWLTEA
jgi:hypothetical protein